MEIPNLPEYMQAMVLTESGKPLVLKTLKIPAPADLQVLIKMIACGVCRTDLHILDGELMKPKMPLIPGHEIVGTVVKTGKLVSRIHLGDIVGVPWLGYTCGHCRYCLSGKENLCEHAGFTGYTIDGGFAAYTLADENYCFPLSNKYANAAGAPLLCAGLIGYRSYRMIPKDAIRIGFYGFGAAAHILIQVARFQHKMIYAFTKEGDTTGQQFALSLGAVWAGDSSQSPPDKLDAAIIFAPVGELVPRALQEVDKSGTVICGGIHMSDIPSFPYQIIWEEKTLHAVANLTRDDGVEFFRLAQEIPIHTEIKTYPLNKANEAIYDLRMGQVQGAAVLVMD